MSQSIMPPKLLVAFRESTPLEGGAKPYQMDSPFPCSPLSRVAPKALATQELLVNVWFQVALLLP